MKYKGCIYQIGPYGGKHEDSMGGFESKEDAFKWAERAAKELSGTISYWVEYDRNNVLRKFCRTIYR